VRIPFTLNDLEVDGSFMASRRCVQFHLFTLDYGIRGAQMVRQKWHRSPVAYVIKRTLESELLQDTDFPQPGGSFPEARKAA
jgi:hypothetical protein